MLNASPATARTYDPLATLLPYPPGQETAEAGEFMARVEFDEGCVHRIANLDTGMLMSVTDFSDATVAELQQTAADAGASCR